ncbi:DUF4142 domain-containing protein [Bdellovibrio sp. HCB337]|uniref:DUF4142 domain-containing protein n=1 Tax=Bdellovibrio sp. HCB337 TaxID=3394358 RepID=UPI0039A45F5F
MMKPKMLILCLAALSFGATANAQAPQTPTLTDAHIVEIMKVANEGEADLGKAAKSRAENKDVKDFAKMMVDQHKKSEKEVKNVAKKANVKAADNATADSLKKDIDTQEDTLKKLKGAEFDKAYIQQQISMHEQLLKDLNDKYIPAAQSAELKAYLETTKTHVQEHLSKAQQIQSTLK